jgi:hypothetical protein
LHYSRHLGSREGRRRIQINTRAPTPLFSGGSITPFDCGIEYDELRDFSVERIIKVVDHLASLGLIHHNKAKAYNPAERDPTLPVYSSSFMATDSLRAMFPILPELRQRADDVIWIKDEYGRRLMVPDTEEVHRMRSNLTVANEFMASVETRLPSDVPFDGVNYHLTNAMGEQWTVSTASTQAHRIFNGDTSTGGRAYGPWMQGVSPELRPRATMNGEPVVELDFSRHHPRIAHAQLKADYPGDAYATPSFPVVWGKKAWQGLMNAKSRRGAEQALRVKPEDEYDTKHLGLDKETASELMSELEEVNKGIESLFYTSAWKWMQKTDSDMMEKIMSVLVAEKVACVPLHDGILIT